MLLVKDTYTGSTIYVELEFHYQYNSWLIHKLIVYSRKLLRDMFGRFNGPLRSVILIGRSPSPCLPWWYRVPFRRGLSFIRYLTRLLVRRTPTFIYGLLFINTILVGVVFSSRTTSIGTRTVISTILSSGKFSSINLV